MSLASLKNINRKTWIIAGVIVILAIAAVFAWIGQSRLSNGATNYQTSAVTRGTLIANVGATGTVRAAQSAILVWKASGRVETVNAAIGDKVATDQILASLAQSTVSKNIILAEADLVTAQKNLDNLTKSNSNVAQAMQTLADAKQAAKDARDHYDSLTRTRASAELIKDTLDQIDQAQKRLKFTEYVYQVFFGYDHMADGRPAKAQMTINLSNSQQNVDTLTARYNWLTAQASAIEIEKAQAALNLAQAKQDDAQREMDRLKNGTNVDDLLAAKARVAAAQATINQSKIIAPFTGTVTQSQPLSGDWVTSGDTAFRVDDLSHLMVDLEISEVDINNVALEQPVTMTFDAVPNKIYNGVVSSVNQSADTKKGAVNFTVTVTLTDADELIKPGMTAAVTITVKEVSSALLVPNRAMRMLNGQRLVYVLKDGQAVPVNIRLGATTDTNSQVVGGDLKEGDLIILNPPVATVTSSDSGIPIPTPVK